MLLFVGVACGKQQPISVKQPEPAPATTAPVQQGVEYTDATYGFSLTLPNAWAQYSTKHRQLDWGAPIGKTDSIDFGLPGDESIFNITALSKGQWSKIQADNDIVEKGTLLFDDGTYVFIGGQAQSVSTKNTARLTEVNAILQTFKK